MFPPNGPPAERLEAMANVCRFKRNSPGMYENEVSLVLTTDGEEAGASSR